MCLLFCFDKMILGGNNMASKGQKFREWNENDKLKIISPLLNYTKTYSQISREYNISNGLLGTWVKKYRENGIEGLKNRKKPGNPVSKYFNKKHFNSKEEELEYEIMKLRIENERLKKEYLVKGDGPVVVFKK